MKNIRKITLILLVGAFLGSCTSGWLDINQNPNVPTKPELSQMLSFSEYYMAVAFGHGYYLGNGLSSYMHQSVSREVQNYGMNMQANNILNSWNYCYIYALKNLDGIIAFAEPEGNLIYAGIAKTLKAYVFSMMVDLWGDIPYTEFNIPGNIEPKPDASKDIYNSLFALLAEALADLQNTGAVNAFKPAADDYFYAGNVARWVKLNNTIQLKLLLQSRKAKSDITNWQSKLTALISANNFIASGEDFQFMYPGGTNPQDMRHPAFTSGGYYTGQHTYYISPFFYETMKGQTYNTIDNPLAGISDPRIPYYFYNQLSATGTPAQPYEYKNGQFVSIVFATNGPNASFDNRESCSKVGIYGNGGKYDTGSGGRVDQTLTGNGNGIAPTKFIPFYALKFMLAELALVGETTGDAKVLLKEAIEAAFAHVNAVVTKSNQAGVPQIAAAARDTYVTAVLTRYDAADAAGKLRILITQKWIANYMSPFDSYTDYRRTGYPVLFDPAKTEDPGHGVNPTVAERSAARIPLLNFEAFPRSLYYPSASETSLNPNLPQKSNLATPFVFWDK